MVPLHDPKDFLGLLFETMSTALLTFDRAQRLLLLNSAAEIMLALSSRQARGTPLGKLFPAPPRLLEMVERAVETGQVLTERNVAAGLPDGRTVEVDCTVSPIPDQGEGGLGASPALLLELTDVENRRRIAKEEQIQIQSEAVRSVLRGLAHEIRNPLGGLRGAAQLLQRGLQSPELIECSNVIIAEADRLHLLMDRMLGPQQVLARRRLNIHELTERVCALIDAESSPAVRVIRDYDPSIPELFGDYDLLIQALLNIGRNAILAVENAGSGAVLVRTRVLRNTSLGPARHRLTAQIEFVDDGPGIPDALSDSLFYPMVTGRPDGTGLGLSIAQSVVRRHNGLIECTSRPGETRFSVLLPIDSAGET